MYAIDYLNFYSHAPRGARLLLTQSKRAQRQFLLTRPSRGATRRVHSEPGTGQYFYSHAPRGARPQRTSPASGTEKFLLTRPSRGATKPQKRSAISVQFLLTRPSRGATKPSKKLATKSPFLLTRPSRGATNLNGQDGATVQISTHTPLAGRDQDSAGATDTAYGISTHTPLAGRDQDGATTSAA